MTGNWPAVGDGVPRGVNMRRRRSKEQDAMHSGEMIRGYFQTHTGEWPALPEVPDGHPLWGAFVEFVADEASGVRKDLCLPIVFAKHGDLLWKAFLQGSLFRRD